MLKIRLQRIGRRNDPAFRIVVVEHTTSPKSGNFVEKIGAYNPKTKENTLDPERAKYWLSKGAQASGTVHNMLVSRGVISGKKVNVLPKKHPPAKEGEKGASASAVGSPATGSAEKASDAEPAAKA